MRNDKYDATILHVKLHDKTSEQTQLEEKFQIMQRIELEIHKLRKAVEKTTEQRTT